MAPLSQAGAGIPCAVPSTGIGQRLTTPHGRLIPTVLGGLAEFERNLSRARSEGRERAKARGVKLGRKPKLTEHQKREAIQRRDPRRGIPCGHRAQLQRQRGDDFTADALTYRHPYVGLAVS
jgi:DNA invertase Pin-like site-specific DNA recombinase